MRKILKFCWYCIKHAWRGCWTRANEQAGLFGGAVLAVLLYFFPPRFAGHGMIMAPETIWGTAALTVLLAAGSVILAFLMDESGPTHRSSCLCVERMGSAHAPARRRMATRHKV